MPIETNKQAFFDNMAKMGFFDADADKLWKNRHNKKLTKLVDLISSGIALKSEVFEGVNIVNRRLVMEKPPKRKPNFKPRIISQLEKKKPSPRAGIMGRFKKRLMHPR